MLPILAMYLPQFHRVPENDKWWGEGFTEWTAVKGAEKLFPEHNQPRIPLNKNYYNLLDYNTMEWQAELMKKYCIAGMCIYHYWFENGKRILEKPAENLLKWEDISMPFCFCWANETWSRTWTKLSNTNVWSSVYEKKDSSDDNDILLRQSYGREKDWEEHFQYLLPFFKDDRYIKLGGKPIFVIWQPGSIYSLGSMTAYFKRRALESGLGGMHIIGCGDSNLSGVDAYCIRQPADALGQYNQKNGNYEYGVKRYPYDEIWENILNKKIRSDKKSYMFGMVDYDDTPRMGRLRGHVIENTSVDMFYKYFKKLYQKSQYLNNDFIFLNAWNEWGEGMYLEPDEKNGFGYLEAVRRVVAECENKTVLYEKDIIASFYEDESEETLRKRNENINIMRRHDSLLNTWLSLHEKGTVFSAYLEKYGYKRVAIYGMGKLGIHLLNELKKCNVEVAFGIDKNAECVDYKMKVYYPEDSMPNVDAVIITIIDQYAEIGYILGKRISGAMIAIEEMLQELYEMV